MIFRAFALAAAVLLTACGEAEPDWPSPAPALWHVTAPDGNEGWLFGTVHALPDGVEWRTPALDAALAQSRVLMAEIADPGSADPALFARLARTPGQPPLGERVAADDRQALATLLDRNDQSEADFATIETWAVALMLDNGASGDPANGVDRALILQARVPLRSLETREGQLRMFDNLPADDQSALLASAIREANSNPGRAIHAWLEGDVDTLDRLAREGLLADASLREALLVARNAAWLPPITSAIESGERPFVAVGAVHLAGADGLPAMLAARGYRVSRVQ